MSNSHHIKQQIRQIRQGNELAFETLFFDNYEQLCKYTWKYVRSMDEAKGIVQDIFADVWQNRVKLDEDKNINGLLFTLAKNRALDTLKHVRIVDECAYQVRATEEGWFQLSGRQPNQATERTLVDGDICRAVDKLPQGARQIFKLHREKGLTYKEIAGFLDISVKTVESQMGRALKLLREHLSHVSISFILFISLIPFVLFS